MNMNPAFGIETRHTFVLLTKSTYYNVSNCKWLNGTNICNAIMNEWTNKHSGHIAVIVSAFKVLFFNNRLISNSGVTEIVAVHMTSIKRPDYWPTCLLSTAFLCLVKYKLFVISACDPFFYFSRLLFLIVQREFTNGVKICSFINPTLTSLTSLPLNRHDSDTWWTM